MIGIGWVFSRHQLAQFLFQVRDLNPREFAWSQGYTTSKRNSSLGRNVREQGTYFSLDFGFLNTLCNLFLQCDHILISAR